MAKDKHWNSGISVRGTFLKIFVTFPLLFVFVIFSAEKNLKQTNIQQDNQKFRVTLFS